MSGGFSTKIHAVVDSGGRPHYLEISPGQVHDISRAESLLNRSGGRAVIADKAYASKQFIKAIHDKNMLAVIPNKSNSLRPHRFAKALHKKRIKVEHFFHDLKRYRGVATRFCKSEKAT